MTRRTHVAALLRMVLIGILAVGCVADVQARSVAAVDPGVPFVCEIMDMSSAWAVVDRGHGPLE